MAVSPVWVIGGGLAGPEAAWQLARRGVAVELYEMRPRISTPAHRTSALGELVCSNSLKSEAPFSAPWLLKEELRALDSLLLDCARQAAVPGGQSLNVERETFSSAIEAALQQHPLIVIRREEIRALPSDREVVLATGPLTSAAMAAELAQLTGRDHLYFYDAISPIVDAGSISMDRVYAAARYGKGDGDYLNCPLDRGQYEAFHAALLQADSYPVRAFEEARYFEACLPLEVLARRGIDTLRFGPMKPVGLPDPRTGKIPYAVVQLRRENLRSDSYNLIGFQNHMRFATQAEVLRRIPGLEQAQFLRYGQVHRNSYVHAPAVLTPTLQLRASPRVRVAGQLCGTEGYVEAIATGLLAGIFTAAAAQGAALEPPPRVTALGSLLHYISHASLENYVPANMTLDLLPELPLEAAGSRPEPGAPPLPPGEAPPAPLKAAVPQRVRDRDTRRRQSCLRAQAAMEAWRGRAEANLQGSRSQPAQPTAAVPRA